MFHKIVNNGIDLNKEGNLSKLSRVHRVELTLDASLLVVDKGTQPGYPQTALLDKHVNVLWKRTI